MLLPLSRVDCCEGKRMLEIEDIMSRVFYEIYDGFIVVEWVSEAEGVDE